MPMPVLETPRLRIRPLTLEDLELCHRLYEDIAWNDPLESEAANREQRRQWLEWSLSNDEQLEQLQQPPYGERAVELRSGSFVGLVGLVPLLAPGDPSGANGAVSAGGLSAEVGLFWAISPLHQRRGYASEAASSLIEYAFCELGIARILAGTSHSNLASIGVMRRLGMRIEYPARPEPSWFQVLGVLDAQASMS
jgi:RimJ/RimL family protein N-acetyltransferase